MDNKRFVEHYKCKFFPKHGGFINVLILLGFNDDEILENFQTISQLNS